MNSYLNARRLFAAAAGVTFAFALGADAHAQPAAAASATSPSCRIVIPSPIVEPMPIVIDLCFGG